MTESSNLAGKQEYKQTVPLRLTPNSRDEVSSSDTPNDGPSMDTHTKDPEIEILEKRYSDLQSYNDKRLSELSEQLRQVTLAHAKTMEELTKAKIAKRTLPLNDEEFEATAKDFDLIDKLAHTRASKVYAEESAGLVGEVEALKKELYEIKKKEARQKLKDLHPDFEKIEADPSFKVWAEAQPAGIKALFLSDNIYEVAKGLSLYKDDAGIKSRKEKELEESLAVSTTTTPKPEGRGEKRWKISDIKKLSAREFEKYADEINKAQKEGRIDFD